MVDIYHFLLWVGRVFRKALMEGRGYTPRVLFFRNIFAFSPYIATFRSILFHPDQYNLLLRYIIGQHSGLTM